jgi:hypothetical protein
MLLRTLPATSAARPAAALTQVNKPLAFGCHHRI